MGETNVYTQQKLRVLGDNWIVHGINCGSKINKDNIEGFCHPTLWMALVYGASILQPKIDKCTLKANGKISTLGLGQVRADSSISFEDSSMTSRRIDIFKRSNTMTTEEQVQAKESNPSIGLSNENIAKRMKIEQVQYFSHIILIYNFYIIIIVSIFYIM